MQTQSDKPKKATAKKPKAKKEPIEVYGLEPLPQKEIVTTPTFKEEARCDWNSEVDVCEFIGSLIKMTKAANVLEIGVFEGETSVKMIEALPYGGKYTGIDINNYLKYDLKSFGTETEFIIGESIKVMQSIKPNTFDFIFVDGDHSWANILPEFKEVERVLAKGGVIAYHDSIHLPDVKELMKYAAHYKYNVVTLNTSEGRGLSILQRL
jgi:predicted O-methyltransferase YrrM